MLWHISTSRPEFILPLVRDIATDDNLNFTQFQLRFGSNQTFIQTFYGKKGEIVDHENPSKLFSDNVLCELLNAVFRLPPKAGTLAKLSYTPKEPTTQ